MRHTERTAILRKLSPAIASCELTHLQREAIDLEEAQRQHDAYARLLEHLGCRIELLPSEPDLADSVFVEDTAIVLDEVALLTRPGALSRRPEIESIAAALAPHRPCLRIEAPATVDGGDVLQIGRRIFVGLSSRTNEAGAAAIREHLEPFDYTVSSVRTRDCLHLKSAMTAIGSDSLLVNRAWLDSESLPDLELVDIDLGEPFSANALLVGESLVHAANFPRTRKILEERGYDVHPVEASELAKAEGAVTCCSLVFES